MMETDILASLIADRRSEHTKRAYRKDLNKFFQFMVNQNVTASRTLNEFMVEFISKSKAEAMICALNFKASLFEQGLSEATVNRNIAAIRSYVNRAKKLEQCEWDLDGFDYEKVTKYRDTSGITARQMGEMISTLDLTSDSGKRDYAILRLLWDLAMNRSEVSKMNIGDFDPKNCTVSIFGIHKGTQKESLSISKRTKLAIEKWIEVRNNAKASEPLFIALGKGYKNKVHRLSGGAIWEMVRKTAKSAGIEKVISPRRIRHGVITEALEMTNGNFVKVRNLSRHSKYSALVSYENKRLNHQGELTDIMSGKF